jgi:D-lactate dehydrogenase
MKVAFFDAHRFEQEVFNKVFLQSSHKLSYFEARLSSQTVALADGFEGVCAFANDTLNALTLTSLKKGGVKLIALRSAGYNHVDLKAAKDLEIVVVRVPEYSPYAVAEHAVALVQTVNRKIHRAYNRVRELNFSLEGLVGFDLHGKTVGIVGTGRIGVAAARIFHGYGCTVLAFDKYHKPELERELSLRYVELSELLKKSDVISLHLPLTVETKHILNAEAFALIKPGAIVVNTGRGALIDTNALISALKQKKLGGAALDVYEVEEGVFFNDLSNLGIDDDILARLLTFPNVVVTSHQAFLTSEALHNIADQTLKNIEGFENKKIINQIML